MCFACIDGEDVRGVVVRPADVGTQAQRPGGQVDAQAVPPGVDAAE